MIDDIVALEPILSIPILLAIGSMVLVIWRRQEQLYKTQISTLQTQISTLRSELASSKELLRSKHDLELAAKDAQIERLQGDSKEAYMKHLATQDDEINRLSALLNETQLDNRQKEHTIDWLQTKLHREGEVIGAILELSGDDPHWRTSRRAVSDLKRLRDPRTIPFLVSQLWQSRPYLQRPVTEALRQFGAEATPALVDAVREWAKMASDPELSDGDLEVWKESVPEEDVGQLIVSVGGAAVPLLKELEREDDPFLKAAAEVLLSAIESGSGAGAA